MKMVRAALWPLLERAQEMITLEMYSQLRSDLGPMGEAGVVSWLHKMRPTALELARSGTSRQWQKLLDAHAPAVRHLVLYAAAAWIMRAIVLAEYLERSELERLPKKWAAEQTLRLIDEVESEDAWLWPFDVDSPWPEWEGEDDA